jgi:hypothetical protein
MDNKKQKTHNVQDTKLYVPNDLNEVVPAIRRALATNFKTVIMFNSEVTKHLLE